MSSMDMEKIVQSRFASPVNRFAMTCDEDHAWLCFGYFKDEDDERVMATVVMPRGLVDELRRALDEAVAEA